MEDVAALISLAMSAIDFFPTMYLRLKNLGNVLLEGIAVIFQIVFGTPRWARDYIDITF